MTEEEWLACIDPAVMLKFLDGKFSERKLRLFAVGLCRLRWDRIFVTGVKELVDLAEQYAERKTTYREWIDAFHSVSCAFTRHVAWPYVQEAAFEVSDCPIRGFKQLIDSGTRHRLLWVPTD
jgi:hypothetical protein